MRILIVDTMYPGFLAEHYGRAPELAGEPYGVQWRALMDRFFGTADSYSHFLGGLGHAAHELVVNCEPLQRRWAEEHGVRTARRWSRPDLVLVQADEFRPDVVYVQDVAAPTDRTLARLGRGRLLVGQIATVPPAPERLRRFDLLLTSFPHFVERFRALGVRSEYFRIGFDPRVLDRLGPTPPSEGAVFVGSLDRRLALWRHGNPVLEEAARRVRIDFWGRGSEDWPAGSPLRTNYRGEAWGLDMLRVLASARIALNRHGDVAEGYANNMRLYEATGVGTLLMTDGGRNLSELFEPGREVVTYSGADDLVAKIRHYLEHEEERAAIARAGRQRTLREHTYAERMRELAAILEVA
jgi:spore maturation protein CgeB